MTIKIKVKKAAPAVAIEHLTGTAHRLAQLVAEHACYEFEGFKWLQGTFGGIADHLGVNERTVRRAVQQPPFHYITRQTEADGRHVLLKLGTEPCESDHVHRLRAVWVKGLVFYNVVAAKAWATKVAQLQHQTAAELAQAKTEQQKSAISALWERYQHRIEKAKEGAVQAAKIEAGEHLSYKVKRYQMGCLRKIVQDLGDDAVAAVACVTTFEGWNKLAAIAKHLERTSGKFYHWPELGVIAASPDLVLETYLEMSQASAKIDPAESARLNAKIASLTPTPTA